MLSIANDTDPRVRRTRRDLEQALLKLLKQHSISKISVRDITEQAGINRATFYAHFVDKYALFDQLICTLFQQVLADRIPESAPLTRTNLHHLTLAVFDFLAPLNSSWCTTPSHSESRPLVENQVQKQLFHRMKTWMSLLSTDQNLIEVNAATVSWGLFGAGLHMTAGSQKESYHYAVNVVVEFIAMGIEQTFGTKLA